MLQGQGKYGFHLRIVLAAFFVFAVIAEGLYIIQLRETVERQSEELKAATLRLQALKNTQSSLQEELDSMKIRQETKEDGTTPKRQY